MPIKLSSYATWRISETVASVQLPLNAVFFCLAEVVSHDVTAAALYKKEVASMQGEPELVPVTTPRNMKELRNLHHKQLQLSRISHDDMYNLHEIAYDFPGYIHKIITFPGGNVAIRSVPGF